MFGLGISEILVIGVVVLLFFGARRLPAIGRGLGETVKEIKKVKRDLKGQEKTDESSEEKKPEGVESGGASKTGGIEEGIESIPGIKEAKTVTETVSQVRKWWRVLKH